MGDKINRTGEVRCNNFGTKMIIVEYNSYDNIIVEFQDNYKYKKKTSYKHFKEGNVKNPYDKIICNVGFLGEGKYSHKEYPKIYKEWNNMLKRCYDPYYINYKTPTYKDCFICNDWHNFQNFAKWYENNIYECNDEKMELDKDILVKGNKIYSPETCIFAPQRINYLFNKHQNKRGSTPIGTTPDKSKIKSQCHIFDKEMNKSKKIYLGLYNNELDAFNVYKNFKENYIKQVADEYKDLIPQKLYDALYKYEVEITD